MTHNISYRIILQKMGYYNYQRGLIYNHLNQEGGWNSHLGNCRNFILKSIDYLRPTVITVLGSGWLLDLPLREMADQMTEINLVDIIHPPEVLTQVSGMKNVMIREEDISGGLISEVWEKAGRLSFFKKLHSLDDIKIYEYQPTFDPGVIISLNILTQLESLPVELLKKKAVADEESYIGFRKAIQQKHISFLKKHRSVLITDFSEIVTERSGKINEITSVLADLPEGIFEEEWTWNFDPKNSDYYNKKSVFRIAAKIL